MLTPHAHVGSIFPEIGSGTGVASPGTSSTEMTISPGGGTLFLAGTANVIILPAP